MGRTALRVARRAGLGITQLAMTWRAWAIIWKERGRMRENEREGDRVREREREDEWGRKKRSCEKRTAMA